MKSLDERSGYDKVPKEPQQEPQALDIETEANAFSRKVIKGLVHALKQTENEDLKKTLHEFIRSFVRFYTLTEMELYITPRKSFIMAKVIKVYMEALAEYVQGSKAYTEYSQHRQALIERKKRFQQQILVIQQNKPAHACGPDCNHDEVGRVK